MGRTLEALGQSMKFTLTPEEHQILGLTEEDVASFSELSPQALVEGITEIIEQAYETPAFKKLVDEDAARDPSRLGRSSKVVSKFLKHLRSVLPPESVASIQGDTFMQAHGLVTQILKDKLQRPAAQVVPEERPEDRIEPITDSELALFNITRGALTAKTRWADIKDGVLFFLGKLRNNEGKVVKNESTKSMPDDQKIMVLSKLFNDIRAKKIEASDGVLSPSDINFLGKDVHQLKQTAKSLVVPASGKPDPVYQNDLIEVNSQIVESLKMMDRIQDISKDTKFTEVISDLAQSLDTALPPVSLFEDRINSIQDEISKLGLSKTQVSALVEVNSDTLVYNDPVTKLLEDQKMALQAVQKETSEKGESPELASKRKGIERQIAQLEALSQKDTSGLKKAIEDYLSTLRAYKENIKKNIFDKKLNEEHQGKLSEFIKMVDQMALVFSRLTREELFKARWGDRTGFLVRGKKPDPATPSPDLTVPPVAPVSKMAGTGTGYASKVERFRGKGLGDAYQEIQDIIESDDKLPAIKGKLIEIIGMKDRIDSITKVFDSGKEIQEIKKDISGLTQGTMYGSQIANILNKSNDPQKLKSVILNILSKDKTIQSYSDGVSHTSIDFETALKLVNRLRSLVKKIKIDDKGSEALDTLKWAATLQNHIKTGKSPVKKLASLSSLMIKIASEMKSSADEKGPHKTYQSPAGVGSEAPYKSPGKAGWLIFRERMTKMGKKALQSFFEEPTFVSQFVEEMEKAGLNKMLLEGGNVSELDVDTVLEDVLKKVTGKKGDLENILGTKTMQKYNSEHSIGKTKKDLEESRARVKKLNQDISDTEDKYLPKLDAFAKFIKDPIGATRAQIEQLRGKGKERDKGEDKDVQHVTEDITPEEINSSNFRSILRQLSDRYVGARSKQGPTKFTEDMFKQAKEIEKIVQEPSEMSRMLPNEFIKQYMVWKKQLKNAKTNIDRQEDPYKRAVELEKYYTFMIGIVRKISDYFEYQGKVIKADETMINGIEAFLKSDAAKNEKEPIIRESRELLNKLKGPFNSQKKFFDNLKGTHPNIGNIVSTIKDQLKTIQDDIQDKKVEMVYQVAISPDLVPDKETARAIKKRYKEHEKGLSYIIDRSTYKNNMNRLMTYKVKRGPIKSLPGQGMVVLPPERKRDLEGSLRAYEERLRRMKEEADYGMAQVALNKLGDELTHTQGIVSNGMELIKNYTSWIENYDYLKKNKDTMDPADYGKQMSSLNSLMEGKGLNVDSMKKEIDREQAYIDRISERVSKLEEAVETTKKELESKRPSMDVPKEIEKHMQVLYRLKGIGQQKSLKAMTPEEQLKEYEEKMKQLEELGKKTFPVQPGTPGEQAYKKFRAELERQVNIAEEDIKNLRNKMGQSNQPSGVQAAIEDTMPDLSTFDKALETKGVKPAPFMQELPKPKGWDIVENFFDEIKREHRLYKDLKEEGKHSTLQSKYLKKRLDQIENMSEAIDSYKNLKVDIGGDPVAFRDVMTEFEDTLSKYEDLLAKYTNQRDSAVDKTSYLQQELDHYNEMYDQETGEFKGLGSEEIANLKGIFLRMLYRDMERYWGTKVGKDLSVFGERDTNWYNNVFMTFKNVASARSNKKMLGILNKYKTETRSDFDDTVNRFKSQQLEKDRDQLLEGYKEYGVNPEISSRLKDLNTRIETLKKQEKQMDRIFNFMGSSSLVAMQADFEKMLRDRSKELSTTAKSDETLKPSKADIGSKADEKVNETLDEIEKGLPVIIDHTKESELATKELDEIKKGMREERGEPTTVPSPENALPGKMAFDRNHRDFNLKILYGSHMQSKIAEIMLKEIK